MVFCNEMDPDSAVMTAAFTTEVPAVPITNDPASLPSGMVMLAGAQAIARSLVLSENVTPPCGAGPAR